MGDQMNEFFSTTKYRVMDQDQVDLTIMMDEVLISEVPMGVPFDDKLSLATSGGFSNIEAEARSEEDN